MAEGKKGAH